MRQRLKRVGSNWGSAYNSDGAIRLRRYLRGQRRVGACLGFGIFALSGVVFAITMPFAFIQAGPVTGIKVMAIAVVVAAVALIFWRQRRWWWPPFRETDLWSYKGEDDPPRL